jgi:hypothetical protein
MKGPVVGFQGWTEFKGRNAYRCRNEGERRNIGKGGNGEECEKGAQDMNARVTIASG